MLRRFVPEFFSVVREALGFLVSTLLKALDRLMDWHKWPRWIGVFILWAFRKDLRKYNLHDTSQIDRNGGADKDQLSWNPKYLYTRTPNGIFNDLKDPSMGSAGSRFGRNFSLDQVWPDEDKLFTPNPRELSRRLLARDVFKPAKTLNILAAAWIQFQNHEWFNHKRDPNRFIEVPLPEDDDWPEHPMRIERSLKDPTRRQGPADKPPTFLSSETHWWDGSQIYASTWERQKQLRSGIDGKLKIEKNGLLPLDPELPGIELTGLNDNYWVGLSLLHNLFAREHNAICDRLHLEYPSWDDDRLFETAWLINGALMAKIHTVEWTPAILGHPALQIAMHANWWGLATERITKVLGRLGDSELISGIPGSPVDHHTAPYYLTEEFVSVYRLHPLIPDDYQFYSLDHDQLLEELSFTDIQGTNTRAVMERIRIPDLYYSFGIAHPGAVTLHNFPNTLRNFQRPDGQHIDLATVDIIRDRERGVPRYNQFRELLHMPRITSFEKLSDNPQWARELRELYNDDIDSVDALVGMYAEPPPKGFGFSDTAFRIFILMASRRLKSDRFFTDDYRPEIYTQTGLDWINNNSMKTVLQRHYPELTPAIYWVGNVFAPWDRVWLENASSTRSGK